MSTSDNPDPSAQRRRAQLARVVESLRALHKELMQQARHDYERDHGPIPSPGVFLNLLVSDAFFQWLRPLSGAMADLDELLDLVDPGPEHTRAVRLRFEALVTEDENDSVFGVRYRDYLQRSAEVVMAHAVVRIALRPL